MNPQRTLWMLEVRRSAACRGFRWLALFLPLLGPFPEVWVSDIEGRLRDARRTFW